MVLYYDDKICCGRYKCSTVARATVVRFFKEKFREVVKTEEWKKAMVTYPDLITELVVSLGDR